MRENLKGLFIFAFMILMLSTSVHAADKNLYNYLKSKAIDDGVQSTYVSNNNGIDFLNPSSETNGRGIYYIHDTKNEDYPIVYYRGDVSNNFIIYAGYCWQILLSTNTGAVKLIYAGVPTDNKCLAEGGNMSLPKTAFGLANDSKYAPYMYSEDGSTFNDSVLKTSIDNWYEANLKDKINEIEDVVYCNDMTTDSEYQYAARYRLLNTGPTLVCPKEYSYTVDSELGNGRLKYPVATVSADELTYIGLKLKDTTSDSFGWINFSYWAMTPYSTIKNMYPNTKHAINENTLTYAAGARPVIAVNNTAFFRSGNGERNTPFSLKVTAVYKVSKGNEYVNLDTTSFSAGDKVSFKVQDRDGFAIEDIEFTDSDGNELNISYTKSGDKYTFEMPEKNVVVTPKYRQLKDFHSLLTNNSNVIIPVDSIEEEQEASFKLNIPHGYKLVKITFSDGNNDLDISYEEKDNTYKFTMPASDVIVDAQLEELPKYKVSSTDVEIKDTEYYAGDKVSFKVKNKIGKKIDKVVVTDADGNVVDVNLTNNGNEYSFDMIDKDLNISVIYDDLINPNTAASIEIILYILISIMSIAGIKLTLKRIREYN